MESMSAESRPRSRLLIGLTVAVVLLTAAVAVLGVQMIRLDRRHRQTRCELQVALVDLASREATAPGEAPVVVGRGCGTHEIFDL